MKATLLFWKKSCRKKLNSKAKLQRPNLQKWTNDP